MRQKRFFGIFLILLAGLLSCSQPKQLVYQDVKNFRIGNLDVTQPKVGMDLQFFNPNSFSLTLKDASIDVYINDQFIGHGNLTSSFQVPAADTFLMPVILSADLKNVFSNALAIVFNKEVKVRLQGSVKAGRGVMLSIPIYYEGTQKLHVL